MSAPDTSTGANPSEQQRDPSLWGISWSGRLHKLTEPVKVDDAHRMYASSQCGSSVYLFGFLSARGRHPSIRRLLAAFTDPKTPACRLCTRGDA